MVRRLSYMTPFLIVALCFLATTETYGSQESMLRWSAFSIDSEGIGSSGPITVSGKQEKSGISAMTVKAFGRIYELRQEHLDLLKSMTVNGMQLSYEGGLKKGDRMIYIHLSSGFFVSGIRARKFVVVHEGGDVLVQQPRSP